MGASREPASAEGQLRVLGHRHRDCADSPTSSSACRSARTEGFLRSLFRMMGLDLSAPDHTTLSRRGQHLDLKLRRAPRAKPSISSSTAPGSRSLAKGNGRPRSMAGRANAAGRSSTSASINLGVIVAQVLTDGNADDAGPSRISLLNLTVDYPSFVADAAYDTVGRSTTQHGTRSCRCHSSNEERHCRRTKRDPLSCS